MDDRTESTNLTETINAWYERLMFGGKPHLHDKIGFFNLGYWKGVEDSVEHAQINLIETLAGFFSNTDGNVLDVACGKGASSKFLTKYFDPAKIVGINISERQLEVCRLVAPECNFQLMNATDMSFEDESFDNILCIEAAIHFSTRAEFFEEAHRILKPAGRLALSDLLCDYTIVDSDIKPHVPEENYLPNWDAYRDSLLKAGFRYVRVDDCTELMVNAAVRYWLKMEEKQFGRKQEERSLERIRFARLYRQTFSGCLAYAIK